MLRVRKELRNIANGDHPLTKQRSLVRKLRSSLLTNGEVTSKSPAFQLLEDVEADIANAQNLPIVQENLGRIAKARQDIALRIEEVKELRESTARFMGNDSRLVTKLKHLELKLRQLEERQGDIESVPLIIRVEPKVWKIKQDTCN